MSCFSHVTGCRRVLFISPPQQLAGEATRPFSQTVTRPGTNEHVLLSFRESRPVAGGQNSSSTPTLVFDKRWTRRPCPERKGRRRWCALRPGPWQRKWQSVIFAWPWRPSNVILRQADDNGGIETFAPIFDIGDTPCSTTPCVFPKGNTESSRKHPQDFRKHT